MLLPSIFRIAAVVAAAIVATCVVTSAQAQTVTGQGSLPSTINVAPVIATPGTPRTVVVSGKWRDACVPQSARVDTTNIAVTRTAAMILTIPTPVAPCAQVVTDYTVRADITPDVVGVTSLVAVTIQGEFVAQGDLVTSTLAAQRALFDVSGLWYSPDASGWGISLTHAFKGSDAAFGTWYVYRADGSTRWYTLQDIKWDVPALRGSTADPPIPMIMTATVYETVGAQCPASPTLIDACIVAAKETRNVGRMTITFTSFDTASIAIDRPPVLLFQTLGNVQRVRF